MSENPVRTTLPKLDQRIDLGDRGLQVSPFCLGAVGRPETVCEAFDAGVNFFFISGDMHWPFYEATRKGVQMLLKRGGDIREKVVIGVVSYVTQPEFCYAPFAEVIDEIPEIGHVDVTIAGGAYSHEYLTRVGIFQSHRKTNYVGSRAIGTSFHDRKAALTACNNNLVDVAFIRYNASHAGARYDLFPHLDSNRKTLLFNFKNVFGAVPDDKYKSLGLDSSYWKPKITDYYRFVLTRPELNGVLFALDGPNQVGELAKALEEGPLDEEEEAFLMNLAAVAEGRAELADEGNENNG